MKLRNIYLGLKDQLPLRRLIRNLLGGGRAMFHPRTHFNHDGSPKICYNTKVTAEKAALKMSEKTGKSFGNWKCFHCDGYHIGKNRPKV